MDAFLPPLPTEEPWEADTDSFSQCSEPPASDELLPSKSTSQVLRSPPQTNPEISAPSEQGTDIYGPPIPKKRKDKSNTSWTLGHFHVTIPDSTWSRDGKSPKNDRLLVYSARRVSTSNLTTHLSTKHHIKPESTTASSSPSKEKLNMQQALMQWVIKTQQPFTAVVHPAFKAMFNATEASLPIKTTDTLHNRVHTDFLNKSNLRQDLTTSCHTVTLSLDVWTSEHQLSILGVINH
ncbi:hypothetical protein F5884DRAFT_869673 [Xylogone sp. PMI_703]|nr:hypothetical protein F5884DRAFT_869673 [Xylogone sp. PMI_703]